MGRACLPLDRASAVWQIAAMPRPTPLRIAFDAAGFMACVAAVLSLLWLPGCGQEAPQVDDQVVAVRELCTVKLLADGQVECTCEVAP